MSEPRICPLCNRPLPDATEGPYCTPLSCDAWTVTKRYDYEKRSWRPVLRIVPALSEEEG